MQICTPIFARSVENPSVPLSALFDDGGDIWNAFTGGEDSSSGVKVTRKKALGYSAIWRGVNLIAGAVGRLTPRVYRRTGAGKEPDPTHPAYKLVRRKPNDYMGAYTFRQTIQAHALLEGNGFGYVVREKSTARPKELLILDPTRTYPVRVNGNLWYVTEVPGTGKKGEMIRLPHTDVIHIRGLGFDGLGGYNVVHILRDTIGGALAARDYGTRYFKNDGRPGIALEVPAGMKDAAVANLRQSWERLHTGIENAHRVAILRDGVKLAQIQKNARDAQLIENREFDSREVANVLGVPPHKVGDPSRTAYNSLESENQSFYDDTLDGWLICWEEEFADKLLTEEEKERDTHCIEFARQELLRTNLAARGSYYVQGVTTGWLSNDEVRGFENLNPIPGGHGEVYYRPANVMPAGEEPEPAPEPEPVEEPPTPEPDPEPDQEAMRSAIRAAVADVFGRMARRLATHATRAAKDRAGFVRWLDVESGDHLATITDALTPIAAIRDALGGGPWMPAKDEAAEFLESFRGVVRTRLEASDLPAAVADSCVQFEEVARRDFPMEFLDNDAD